MSLRTLIAFGLILAALVSCAPVTVGRPLKLDPRTELKVGHDQKADVLRKLGEPYRRFVDSLGNEVFTYVWADGRGNGQKCLIAFNKNDAVFLVEVMP